MAIVLAASQPWLKDEWSDERWHPRPSFANNTLAAAGDFTRLRRAIEYRRLRQGGRGCSEGWREGLCSAQIAHCWLAVRRGFLRINNNPAEMKGSKSVTLPDKRKKAVSMPLPLVPLLPPQITRLSFSSQCPSWLAATNGMDLRTRLAVW